MPFCDITSCRRVIAMPPPRPATEASSGSLEPGRPSRARSANTRHPAGHRMYATDVRQYRRLLPHGRGIIMKTYKKKFQSRKSRDYAYTQSRNFRIGKIGRYPGLQSLHVRSNYLTKSEQMRQDNPSGEGHHCRE